MRGMWWAMALVLVAGCVDPPATDDESDDDANVPGVSIPDRYLMTACYEQAASFPVPPEDYADRLPDGFGIAPYTAGGSIAATPTDDARGELFVVASKCLDADEMAFERAFTALFVTPPEALRNPDATFGHLLVLAYWTPSAAHEQVWRAWGLQPLSANLSIEHTDTGLQRTGTAAFPATAGAQLTTQVTMVEQTLPANTARFFAANETGVTGVADAEFGALSAYLGSAQVSGAVEHGIDGGTYDGVGFHAFGHSNDWTPVSMDA